MVGPSFGALPAFSEVRGQRPGLGGDAGGPPRTPPIPLLASVEIGRLLVQDPVASTSNARKVASASALATLAAISAAIRLRTKS
jgi:hypothetical protein